MHHARLLERHIVLVPMDALPGGHADVARLHAEAWARAHGLEITGMSEHHLKNDRKIGVSFEVTVGNGDIDLIGVSFEVTVGNGDIHLDQHVPGARDFWRWSGPRMEFWRSLLGRTARPSRLATRPLDNGGRVLTGPWLGSQALDGPDRSPRALDSIKAHPGWSDPAQYPSYPVIPPVIPPADQRPPWLRRGDGWDEDDEPLGEGVPPGLRP